MMQKTRRSALIGLMAGALGLSAGLPATALAEPEVTLRVAHFLPPSSTAQTQLIEPWAKAVEADSGGRIAVEIYPAMQLGGRPPQLIDQVRTGVADVVWTLPGYTPGRFPKTEVFELPFMVPSAEAGSQALWAFYEKHLRDEYADVHPLVLHVHAPGTLHMREDPVTKMADLEGKKIRLPSQPIGRALDALGAVPVGMPVPATYEALERGVVDGALLPWEVVAPLRINELTRHHLESDLYTATFLFAMNNATYADLPDDLKAVIDTNSGAALAGKVGRAWDAAEVPARQAAKEAGHSFHALTPEQRERWAEATRPVIAEWTDRTENGQSLYEEARALVDRFASEGE
ncbi:TRAP dicarboxylate transporter- DctP subunit [Caenispirillum salinarum AK4]|uniref:TRAP dicarboxylate transporter-DctP subunit n=1 Tax=Caenispirillum salinarum AK4 TaxID=1238182 RepID=K9HLV8_9PROT|nr:TRAP transporter substrate-binding protein [Caenispirillum salinarum]EKV31333.1 TRAP dicarboxylate transporter- DctP subunit [Caenispirillum salinarum AK4]